MKKIFILFAIVVTSCEIKQQKLEKPFIIVYKNVAYNKGLGHYTFQDANGNLRDFSDTPEAYKIGDTIQ